LRVLNYSRTIFQILMIGFKRFSKDLWFNSGDTVGERSRAQGFSYIGGTCGDSRFSIAEEIGGFLNIPVFSSFT